MKFSSFTKTSNSFYGNILKLVTGTVLAQALGIFVMPIVTRFFAPEAFGVFAVFSSMTGIVGVVVCLRYEVAIMLPQGNEEAVNLFFVSIISAIFITTISSLIVWLWGGGIVTLLNAQQIDKYLWMIPLAILFQGLFLTLNQWNARIKHFGRLSVAQIISSLIAQTAKLIAAFLGFVSGGVLIGIFVLGSIVTSILLGVQIWREDKKLFFDHVRWRTIGKGAVRFKKFPIIDTWGMLLNAISWQLPTLMLSSFFSLSSVGFYALGLNVIKTPLNIISVSISQVFYQEACNNKEVIGNNDEFVETLMDKLIFIAILPTILLSLVGEELFSSVFGAEWVTAGTYVQILSPWLFFWFIYSPLSVLFSTYERQGTALFVHSIIFITRVISLYIGGFYHNIYLALGLFSSTGVASYVFAATWNIKLAGANRKRIFSNFSKYFTRSMPICFFLFLIKYIYQFGPHVILSSAFLLVVVYCFAYRSKYASLLSSFKR